MAGCWACCTNASCFSRSLSGCRFVSRSVLSDGTKERHGTYLALFSRILATACLLAAIEKTGGARAAFEEAEVSKSCRGQNLGGVPIFAAHHGPSPCPTRQGKLWSVANSPPPLSTVPPSFPPIFTPFCSLLLYNTLNAPQLGWKEVTDTVRLSVGLGEGENQHQAQAAGR